ncbi:MAG: PAS domain S-box protein [Cyanobacteria bacterium]|nr:PAS domain S-box protein [Cyanobacteriota bacterium]
MRATTLSVQERRTARPIQGPRSPLSLGVARFPISDELTTARERALARFANDLSPATGHEFFELLVEFIAECLGFEVAVIAELPPDGDGGLLPIATYPASAGSSPVMQALISTHCERLVESGFSRLGDIASDAAFDLPITGSDGRPLGIICGFGHAAKVDDMTTTMMSRIVAHRAAAEMERQRSARELERRDALFIGMISETQDIVGILDAKGAFSTVSPAIERVLGFCPETCTGLPVVDLVHPLDRESVAALLRIGGSQGYSVEARLRREDQTWLTMEVTVAEHHDADGQTIKVLSARDLTDRRRLEDRLRQSQKTEMIGRLATGIAHDFGNILMVVRSHADVMRLRTTADDPRHSYVDAIQEAVTRGADLARQLLAFSRHRESETRRVDLNTAIEQSAALLRRVVGSSIRLETRLAADARYVTADPTQIEQVILNLMLNARDAMPNGGTITFTTCAPNNCAVPAAVAAAPEDFVCFAVTDTGCGIPEHVQPRIFEPLFTTKADGAGSGIGLATVHDIVTRHGGCIDVVSVEGVGSTFNVFLRRTVAPMPRSEVRTTH